MVCGLAMHEAVGPLGAVGMPGGLEWIVILVVLGAVALASSGALRSQPGVAKALRSLVIGIAALVAVFVALAVVGHRASRPMVANLLPAAASPSPVVEMVSRWESPGDLGYAADPYPSMSSAADGLTGELLRQLGPSPWAGLGGEAQELSLEGITRARVVCEASELADVIAARVARVVPAARVTQSAATQPFEERQPEELVVEARPSGDQSLTIRMAAGAKAVSDRANVRVASWVENPRSATDRGKLGGPRAVFFSGNAQSEAEALGSALAGAGRHFQPRMASRISYLDEAAWVSVLANDIHRQTVVKDTFVQRLATHAGPAIYRAAVLVDVSDNAEGNLSQMGYEQWQGQRMRTAVVSSQAQRAKWLGALVLGVLILVIYLVVNGMRRGYYVAVLIAGGTLAGLLLAV